MFTSRNNVMFTPRTNCAGCIFAICVIVMCETSLSIFRFCGIMILEFLTGVLVEYLIDSVKLDGIDMDYLKFGGGGRALVIIPGLSVKSVMEYAGAVADAYKIFCDDYTVYLFNRNKIINNSTTIYDTASSTAAAIHSLGIDSTDFSFFKNYDIIASINGI